MLGKGHSAGWNEVDQFQLSKSVSCYYLNVVWRIDGRLALELSRDESLPDKNIRPTDLPPYIYTVFLWVGREELSEFSVVPGSAFCV